MYEIRTIAGESYFSVLKNNDLTMKKNTGMLIAFSVVLCSSAYVCAQPIIDNQET